MSLGTIPTELQAELKIWIFVGDKLSLSKELIIKTLRLRFPNLKLVNGVGSGLLRFFYPTVSIISSYYL